jgi:hypothetical protein
VYSLTCALAEAVAVAGDESVTRTSQPRTRTQLLWLASAGVRGRTRQTTLVPPSPEDVAGLTGVAIVD